MDSEPAFKPLSGPLGPLGLIFWWYITTLSVRNQVYCNVILFLFDAEGVDLITPPAFDFHYALNRQSDFGKEHIAAFMLASCFS